MKPQSAGEKTVSVGHLDDVFLRDTVTAQAAGNDLGEDPHIVFGVSHDCGVSRSSRRGMDPDDLVQGHGEEAEGIVITHFLLFEERDMFHVGQGFKVVGMESGLIKFIMVMLVVIIGMCKRPFEALVLKLLHFL